ncbi:MAG: hypothetical protein J3Q66DRAFT_395609 [Benniella sp.]|nr:MAG: hypothetical protein J3Q66DRAFT_395609 [Benniella sp.]
MSTLEYSVDLQACLCSVLQRASDKPTEVSTKKIDNDLSEVMDMANTMIYVDGQDTKEKQATSDDCKARRQKAKAKAAAALDKLEGILDQHKLPGKQLHVEIKKSIGGAFHFSQHDRLQLADYLERQDWTLKVAITEADVEIAKDCGPLDVVLTKDSDALIYNAADAEKIVKEYLAHPRVSHKIQELQRQPEQKFNFDVPGGVFIHAPDGEPDPSAALHTRYLSLVDIQRHVGELKQQRNDSRAERLGKPSRRHGRKQKRNRYRTIGVPSTPAVVPGVSTRSPTMTPGVSEPTSSSTLTPDESDRGQPMSVERPRASLDIATLFINAKRAGAATAREVTRILQDIVRITAGTKKRCQLLLGKYIELVTASPQLHPDDKNLLDMLCPRILKSDLDSADDNEDEDEAEAPESQQEMFAAIMTYLYSDNLPRKAGAAKLINRLEPLGMLSRKCLGALRGTAGGETAREFQQHYKKRTAKIFDRLVKKKEKGKTPKEDISIDLTLPAIKNFVRINQLDGNEWRIVPVSPIIRPFFAFSEADLILIFRKSDSLKHKMNELVRYIYTTIQEYETWYKDQAPGVLITQLITDVGCSTARTEGRHTLRRRIAAIERPLPSLRGHDASVAKYEHPLQQVGDNLETFYNKSSNTIKGYQRDSQRPTEQSTRSSRTSF